MKFTEESLIQIKGLAEMIAEQADLGNMRTAQKYANQLKDIIDDECFKEWYTRMLNEWTGKLRNPEE